LLVTSGCAYLFQRDTVLRINAFMREKVFHDSHVLLNGRRVGMTLITAGLLLLILTLQVAR
jgi:hypothetical protein